MGGPFDDAAFNHARVFDLDFALGNFTGYWVCPAGPLIGVILAVIVARFLRGLAKAQESQAAMGMPIDTN
jgi:hypothetical protein